MTASVEAELSRDAATAFSQVGKVALVTGAASGIGEETARVLAAAGAYVYCADLDLNRVTTVAAEIVEAGGQAKGVGLDVSQREQMHDIVAQVISEQGHLDVMCNVAGIMLSQPVLEVSEADFDKVLGINLKGVLFGCQEAAAVMKRGASIINMASAIIDKPSVGIMSYASSKGGVQQLTRSFALELGPQGIRVNGVAPGWIITGITKRHFTDENGVVDAQKRDEKVGDKAAGSPLNMIGEPIDIAMAVLYLASDAARFWTGQILRCNGGTSMA